MRENLCKYCILWFFAWELCNSNLDSNFPIRQKKAKRNKPWHFAANFTVWNIFFMSIMNKVCILPDITVCLSLFCSNFFQPTVRRNYSSHWEKLSTTFEIKYGTSLIQRTFQKSFALNDCSKKRKKKAILDELSMA